MISKKERWIGALIYLFELGYLFGWNMKSNSTFLQFHFEEASKLIMKLVLPAVLLIFLALMLKQYTKPLMIAALIVLGIYLIISTIAAYNAWKGNTKKML
jgi:hypothetical protein